MQVCRSGMPFELCHHQLFLYAVGTNTCVNCTVTLISSMFQSCAALVRLEFGGKWILYFSVIYCVLTF